MKDDFIINNKEIILEYAFFASSRRPPIFNKNMYKTLIPILLDIQMIEKFPPNIFKSVEDKSKPYDWIIYDNI